MDGRRNFPQDPGTPDPARWYQDEPEWERRYADPYAPDSYAGPEAYDPGYDPGHGYPDVPAPAAPPLPPIGPRSGEPLPPPVSGGAGLLGTPSAPPLHTIPPPGPHSAPPGPPGPGPGIHAGRPAPTGHALADPASGQTGEIPLEELMRRHAEPLDRTAMRRTAPELTGSVYRGRRPGLAALLIIATVVFELPIIRIFAGSALAAKADASGTIASVFMILGLPMFGLGLYGLIGGGAATAQGPRAWLRAPLAYLPIGLLLFVAAAIAA